MGRTGRPAKLSIEEIDNLLGKYVVETKTTRGEIIFKMRMNDITIADEISAGEEIEIDRNQVAYFRRRHNISPCGDNHGGQRPGAGRKSKDSIPDEVNGVIVDFASPYAANVLHRKCTFVLSMDCKGQGLTSDKTETEITKISRKIKKADQKMKERIFEENKDTLVSILGEEQTNKITQSLDEIDMIKIAGEATEAEEQNYWTAYDDFVDANNHASLFGRVCAQ